MLIDVPGRQTLTLARSIQPNSPLPKTSVRDFRSEHVDLLDRWCLGKQLGGLRHQGRRNLAAQMRFAACVISKRIEDAEGCRSEERRVGKECRL